MGTQIVFKNYAPFQKEVQSVLKFHKLITTHRKFLKKYKSLYYTQIIDREID